MVEHVEELRPQLQVRILGEVSVLEDGEIQNPNPYAVAAQLSRGQRDRQPRTWRSDSPECIRLPDRNAMDWTVAAHPLVAFGYCNHGRAEVGRAYRCAGGRACRGRANREYI